MIKLVLMVTLVGVLVRPSHSGNCCSSLLNSAKAAADTALFATDVATDVVNGLNLYWGPSNATINETEGVNATGIGDDIALFATDVVTDVFNELNLGPGNATDIADDIASFATDVVTDVFNRLNLGPGNATMDDDTAKIKDGRIRKAHPIWGISMMAIPFLPMMIVWFLFPLSWTKDLKGGACIRIGAVLFSIPLCVPFSAVATPISILMVCGFGIYGIIRPANFKPGDSKYKHIHGILKTAEISVESAIQTCLGLYIVFILGI